MRKFAFETVDGVTVVGIAPKEHRMRVRDPELPPLTDESSAAEVIANMKRKGTMPASAVPTPLPHDWQPPDGNRAYRAAWKLSGNKVDVDMPKAREIHMGYIRAARDKKLEETDKLVAALDGAAIPAVLRAQRQKLRDLPQTLDLSQANTPDELKAIWPIDLR